MFGYFLLTGNFCLTGRAFLGQPISFLTISRRAITRCTIIGLSFGGLSAAAFFGEQPLLLSAAFNGAALFFGQAAG